MKNRLIIALAHKNLLDSYINAFKGVTPNRSQDDKDQATKIEIYSFGSLRISRFEAYPSNFLFSDTYNPLRATATVLLYYTLL